MLNLATYSISHHSKYVHSLYCFGYNNSLYTPPALQGSGLLSMPGQAGSRADKPCERSHIDNCSRIIFKYAKDMHCPKISDDFDYGGKFQGFIINAIKILSDLFFIFQLCALKITFTTLTSVIFLWSFCVMEINCPKISNKFDYGGSASSDTCMCIMDGLISWSILAFLDSFFKLKS